MMATKSAGERGLAGARIWTLGLLGVGVMCGGASADIREFTLSVEEFSLDHAALRMDLHDGVEKLDFGDFDGDHRQDAVILSGERSPFSGEPGPMTRRSC